MNSPGDLIMVVNKMTVAPVQERVATCNQMTVTQYDQW